MSLVDTLGQAGKAQCDLLASVPVSGGPASWTLIDAPGYKTCVIDYVPVVDEQGLISATLEFHFEPFDAAAGLAVPGYAIMINGVCISFGAMPLNTILYGKVAPVGAFLLLVQGNS